MGVDLKTEGRVKKVKRSIGHRCHVNLPLLYDQEAIEAYVVRLGCMLQHVHHTSPVTSNHGFPVWYRRVIIDARA
jgi:hypothetical protein